MQAQIKRGEPPTGYRAAWLRESARLVTMLVAQQGEALNARHPEDAASLADLFDVLATARTMLLAMAPRDSRPSPAK
jgi:hypothetical protein